VQREYFALAKVTTYNHTFVSTSKLEAKNW